MGPFILWFFLIPNNGNCRIPGGQDQSERLCTLSPMPHSSCLQPEHGHLQFSRPSSSQEWHFPSNGDGDSDGGRQRRCPGPNRVLGSPSGDQAREGSLLTRFISFFRAETERPSWHYMSSLPPGHWRDGFFLFLNWNKKVGKNNL